MKKVRDFILNNYTEYMGDDSFLVGPSEKTKNLFEKVKDILYKNEMKVDLEHLSGIDNFPAGYIDKENEVIYGLQTGNPLERIVNPFGGIRMINVALEENNLKLNNSVTEIFTKYRKTHNQGVFDAYTKDVKKMRKSGVITGLPDAYGRGRIIGDYRRVPLFGVDALIEDKQKDLENIIEINEDTIRLREEVSEQVNALLELKSMSLKYGFDMSFPAKNSKEAIQWTYFAYLAAIKESNGAAMSLGRCSTFFDIYIEKDLKEGIITEKEAQELIDQFVIKLRLVRHLRTKDYDELFAGDPTWVTESIGGITTTGKSLVTKTSYRMLQTLVNLGPSPEPNLTILWSKDLPINFKRFASRISIETSSIQYENDDIMRPIFGDDYGIACCVSAMKIGEQMQYFGARCNIAKALLYAINGGIDEVSFEKVIDGIEIDTDEVLNYDKVYDNYIKTLKIVAKNYVDAMNIIHHMHDKYAYERIQMALHNTEVERLMSFGIAGLSVVIDSLSAIKNAKVIPIRNEKGIAIDFEIKGDYPKFGNDIDDVDNIGKDIIEKFYKALKRYPLIRNAKHTLSVLTITSNVVYGKKTGSTPDGRKAGEPFAPGANPMHNRDENGALASLNSVAKMPYTCCLDGISNTFSMAPSSLGKKEEEQINNLITVMGGYFENGAHHLNVNVLNKETLKDAMEHPENYPNLTIRVSGYAVNFIKLSKCEQLEVLSRTFHEKI